MSLWLFMSCSDPGMPVLLKEEDALFLQCRDGGRTGDKEDALVFDHYMI